MIKPIKLYNTLSRAVEEFRPLHENSVTLYTCGPTVYNYAHIGNLRTYIFEDVLRRTLETAGYHVTHAMNITDVGHLTDDADDGEDKMEIGASREGKTAWEVASFYEAAFWEDCRALNILKPVIVCKATDYIDDQIALIQRLEERGFTYHTSDGIYFDTSKFPNYGQLSHLDIAGLTEGARVAKNPEKRNATDFALWKFSEKKGLSDLSSVQGSDEERTEATEYGRRESTRVADAEMSQRRKPQRQMEWQSPWGIGFPGWHIECSAMSMKLLGETIDIHCGGIDHKPVHHTNEIAQSEAATGKQFVRTWMHGEFLVLDKENKRMGKSEGNMITLNTLHERMFDPLHYRYLVLGAHYRSQLHFSWQALEAAQRAYDRLVTLAATWDEPQIGCAEFEQRFDDALARDLNTPQGLAILWELVKSQYPTSAKAESLKRMDTVLGLSLWPHAQQMKKKLHDADDDIMRLVREREEARANKNFTDADQLRTKILELGFTIEDTPDGPSLRIGTV